MAAIVKDYEELYEHHVNGKGYRELSGIGTFNSTDATGTLNVSPFNTVLQAQLTPIGSPAADELLSISDTPSNGKIAPTSNAITVKRTGASKTSALKFFYLVRGR